MQITKNWLLEHGICVDKFDVYHCGRKITAHMEPDGYFRYSFRHNTTQYNIYAHVLMYTWFIQDIPEGYQIHHRDRDKSNNDIKNLEMLTEDDHRDRHDVHVGKNMTFKCKMPKKKIYTLEYLDYKIETSKLAYEEAKKNNADPKTLHAVSSNYWGWVNKKKQFIGDL